MLDSQLESLDSVQGVSPGRPPRSTGRHGQARSVAPAEQPCGHQENAIPQGLQGGGLELRRQAQPAEVGETIRAKVDGQSSGAFGHRNEPYLLGSIHSEASRCPSGALAAA
jgi:hypothetical protein